MGGIVWSKSARTQHRYTQGGCQVTTRSLSKPSLPLKSLAILATILSLPFLAFYWMALGSFIPDAVASRSPGWLTPLSLVLYLPCAFVAYTLFGNLYVYILATIGGIAAAIAGLIWGRPNRLLRVWLLMVVFAIIAFPFFYRYQPALVAAPGYRMQMVTDPGLFGGIIKTSHNVVEQTPCTYELLGWSTDNQLYYQATCGAETRIWRYSPTQPGNHVQVSNSPTNLSTSTIPGNAVMEMVRARGVKPEEYESVTRPILLKSRGVVSPDGRWTAVVTQHIYGTQDVIVLTDAR